MSRIYCNSKGCDGKLASGPICNGKNMSLSKSSGIIEVPHQHYYLKVQVW